ncbi:MAG: EamA family transporter [Anaerolineae bacterium]|nr:EamA family transporter [Anaerolineae bacterium]
MSREILTALVWLIPAMLLTTTGELFLKRGMNEVGVLDFAALDTLVPTFIKIFKNPNIWIGFVGFGLGSLFWLSVISRVPLSLAYPMLGLMYVIIVIESWIFLGEGLHPLRVLGALIVGLGVAIVGLSGVEH